MFDFQPAHLDYDLTFAKFLPLGVTALYLMSGPPGDLGLWAVFATSIAGVITNYVNRRADAKLAEQRHKWEIEARLAQAQQVKESLQQSSDALRADIQVVTTKVDSLTK